MHGADHSLPGAGFRSPDGSERDPGIAQLEQHVADPGRGLPWHLPTPHGGAERDEKWASPGALIAVILFCVLWRLPSLADPPWLNDEGTYATVGRAVFAGEALYRQIWENKPPAIYLLYGTVHTLVGPSHLLIGVRLLALLAALIVQIAIYRLVRRQRGATTALLATGIAGLLVDQPLLEGTSANAEIFLAAATSVGMALLWRAMSGDDGRRRVGAMAAAGVAFGVAILFKLVAGADLVAAICMLLVWHDRRRFAALGALLGGATLPLAAVALWLAARGLLGDAIYATVTYNRGYVTTGQTLHGPLLAVATLAVPAALVVLAVWLARQPASARDGRASLRVTPEAAACFWLALAILGALASGRAYPHYFLQAVPPLAISLALLAAAAGNRLARRSSRAEERRPPEVSQGGIPAIALAGQAQASTQEADRLQRALLAALLAVWTLIAVGGSWLALRNEPAHAQPGSDPVAYYGHFWRYLTGALDATAYGNALDARVERNLAVASYLKAHPLTPRRLYIWGNTPWIYYLSGYEHAARFISAYYRPPIPGGMEQVVSSLRRQPPPYIVVIEPPLPSYAALSHFIHVHYRAVWHTGNAVIYRSAGAVK